MIDSTTTSLLPVAFQLEMLLKSSVFSESKQPKPTFPLREP